VLSPDLTHGVPKNMDKVMGRSWSIDELASKGSSANITSLAESPLDENILYAGTGDGLIHVTTDGGKTWMKSTGLPVDRYTRVHQITASSHNKLVAYAACQAMNNGDYKPHLFKTTDGGKTWTSINSNLPSQGSTYCVAEDHVNPNLLFTGTQFGLYMTIDGGKEWIKFMNGLPVTTVMDIEIQKRENDLVVCTFGRGVYILDDYSPLRNLNQDTLKTNAIIFPVKDAKMFVEANPFGFPGKAFMGARFYTASNPAFGATFTYWVKEESKTLKQKRREAEKEKQKKGELIDYPSYDELRKEAEQTDPYLLFTISDSAGNIIRKIKTTKSKGVNRVTWDLRYLPFEPVSFTPFDDTYAWNEPDKGYMVLPGTYKVSLQQFDDNHFTELVPPQPFVCKPLNEGWLSVEDRKELESFNRKVANLTAAMNGADAYRKELVQKIPFLKQAALDAVNIPAGTYEKVIAIERKLEEINRNFNGDGLRARYEGASPISLKGRIDRITGGLWSTTAAPTQSYMASYDVAASGFEAILESLKTVASEIKETETLLNKYNAPYTPGRLPEWKKE
jgi:hypothetical protein